jgi:hypothetical protein
MVRNSLFLISYAFLLAISPTSGQTELTGNGTAIKSPTVVTETFSSGSFIVNMGITPQSVANGLKPYGLIYDLVANYYVPVKWVIEPTKAKDGADFVYNSVNYKGGPFIIPAEYISTDVAARITYFRSIGVQGVYTTAPISVPVQFTITNFPVIMIDTISGLQAIIQNYYVNAGIPSTAYALGAPAGLTQCYDIWTNPHGDPNWSTHGYLYNFVTQQKGWIWGQCHAVSALEDVMNPSPPYEQLNFLSQNGLKCWQNGACGSSITENHALASTSPYTNYNHTDPEMQYMADLYLATQAGSEKWFHPLSTGGWRPSTKIGVSTATGIAPNQGVLAVYGYAYGDTAYGKVEYLAGHDLTSGGGGGAVPHKVAAQRCYFNFLIQAGKAKQLLISSSVIPATWIGAQPQYVSVSVSSGIAPFTYAWSATVPGYFFDSTAASTYFVPDSSTSTINGVLRCVVTDACGRKNFIAEAITVYATPLPVKLTSFTADVVNNSSVQLKWSTASEINNDFFTLERSKDGVDYSDLSRITGAGNSTMPRFYSFSDEDPYSGISYYRLRQTDYDGTSEAFNPLTVHFKSSLKDFTACVYPNPFRDEFTVEFYSEVQGELTVELLGLRTKITYSEKIPVNKGFNSFHFNKANLLTSKVYILRFKDEENVIGWVKLLKE